MRYLRHKKSGELVECEMDGDCPRVKGILLMKSEFGALGFELVPEPLKWEGVADFTEGRFIFPVDMYARFINKKFKCTLEEIV